MPVFTPKFAQNSLVPGVNGELSHTGQFAHLKEILQGLPLHILDVAKTGIQEGIHYAIAALRNGIQSEFSFLFNTFLTIAKKVVLTGDSLAANLATLIAELLKHLPGAFGG